MFSVERFQVWKWRLVDSGVIWLLESFHKIKIFPGSAYKTWKTVREYLFDSEVLCSVELLNLNIWLQDVAHTRWQWDIDASWFQRSSDMSDLNWKNDKSALLYNCWPQLLSLLSTNGVDTCISVWMYSYHFLPSDCFNQKKN